LFSPDPLVSSNNKTDRHDITEMLLKVALSTIKQTNYIGGDISVQITDHNDTNKANPQNIAEILLKVALNTIKPTKPIQCQSELTTLGKSLENQQYY
jgi:hypothetical protein